MQSSHRGSARPSRREPLLVLVVVLALAAGFAVGCGDDTTAPQFPRDEVVVDVRDGIWNIVQRDSLLGCPSDSAQVFEDSLGLCSVDFTAVVANPQLILGVECESFVDDGTDFSFACNVGFNLDPCIVNLRVEGSGTRDSTSLSWVIRSWTADVAGPGNPCDIYAEGCTLEVEVTGTFGRPLTGSCPSGEVPDAVRLPGIPPGS